MTITWVVQKKQKSGKKVGVFFTQANKDRIVIISEVKDRAAKNTDLVPGLKVLQVCGAAVRSAAHATKVLDSAPKGSVRIVTEGKHHSATKTKANGKPGFICQPSFAMDGLLEISKVNPNGMFPDLEVGSVLWSINGTVIKSEDSAIELLEKENTIKLVVVNPKKYYGIETPEKSKESPIEFNMEAVEDIDKGGMDVGLDSELWC
jgi:hypothetical protein